MNDEVQLRLERCGINPIRRDVVLETLSNLPSISGLNAHLLLIGSNSRYVAGCRPNISGEGFSYLANMFWPTLEEELAALTLYTQYGSSTLALGRAGHWKDLWSDWHHTEKKRLEESVLNMKLQRDKYLKGVENAFTSLTRA